MVEHPNIIQRAQGVGLRPEHLKPYGWKEGDTTVMVGDKRWEVIPKGNNGVSLRNGPDVIFRTNTLDAVAKKKPIRENTQMEELLESTIEGAATGNVNDFRTGVEQALLQKISFRLEEERRVVAEEFFGEGERSRD